MAALCPIPACSAATSPPWRPTDGRAELHAVLITPEGGCASRLDFGEVFARPGRLRAHLDSVLVIQGDAQMMQNGILGLMRILREPRPHLGMRDLPIGPPALLLYGAGGQLIMAIEAPAHVESAAYLVRWLTAGSAR